MCFGGMMSLLNEGKAMAEYIYEAEASEKLVDTLITFSEQWAKEDITYGYRKNDVEDIAGNRIFLAEIDGEIVGYLFGKTEIRKTDSTVVQKGESVFEVEELYVIPAYRSKGIGRRLFAYMEETLEKEADCILLSMANKDYRKLLHFYIDEIGMEFWSARLYKRI